MTGAQTVADLANLFKAHTGLPMPDRAALRRPLEPVAGPESPEALAREIRALKPEALLSSAGKLEAYMARRNQIPTIIREIGRLREIAFRQVGEGTARARDIDEFDSNYLHLFLWNRDRREIAGGYRLAPTDHVRRLYTATLFQYGPEFLGALGPAVELGRSFIRVEYQRAFSPLLLLWKAIGRWIAANPKYKVLFGPVTISGRYDALSRELMMSFLEQRFSLGELVRLVKARDNPVRNPLVVPCDTVDELSSLVAELAPSESGIPVLLRHYLRLGGKLLGFNIDPEFSDALDGLIVVDLTKTEPKLLERYLGKAESAAFLAYQKGSHATY